MIARLPDELVLELERASDEPLQVENPRNHKLYLIIPADRFSGGHQDARNAGGEGEWTEEKNARRFALIDREIAGTLSAAEAVELQHLQEGIDDYLRRVAPLPLTAARDLHEQLGSAQLAGVVRASRAASS
jgi:hypothetical protein